MFVGQRILEISNQQKKTNEIIFRFRESIQNSSDSRKKIGLLTHL